MKTRINLKKGLSDKEKVMFLLRKRVKFNDISGARRYNIYFAHQRVSELRREGWIIESVKNLDGKVETYKLISESIFQTAKENAGKRFVTASGTIRPNLP